MVLTRYDSVSVLEKKRESMCPKKPNNNATNKETATAAINIEASLAKAVESLAIRLKATAATVGTYKE